MLPPPARRFATWAAVAGYGAVIFHLSSLQNPLPELTARASDKLLHAVEYAGLAVLLLWALAASGLRLRSALAAAVAAASLYAASDELHQAFVPGRDASPLDWAADTVGAALGAGTAAGLRRLRRGRKGAGSGEAP